MEECRRAFQGATGIAKSEEDICRLRPDLGAPNAAASRPLGYRGAPGPIRDWEEDDYELLHDDWKLWHLKKESRLLVWHRSRCRGKRPNNACSTWVGKSIRSQGIRMIRHKITRINPTRHGGSRSTMSKWFLKWKRDITRTELRTRDEGDRQGLLRFRLAASWAVLSCPDSLEILICDFPRYSGNIRLIIKLSCSRGGMYGCKFIHLRYLGLPLPQAFIQHMCKSLTDPRSQSQPCIQMSCCRYSTRTRLDDDNKLAVDV